MWHVKGTGVVHPEFWWGNLRGRPLGRHTYRCKYNIKMDLQELGWRAWAGNFLTR